MNKLKLYFLLYIFLLTPVCAFSKPFLHINNVESNKNFPNIKIEVNVKGNDSMPVYGLTEDNLVVYEDGYRVNYIKVTNAADFKNEVIYLVFSVDSSKSITEDFLKKVKEAITGIVAISGKNEKIALMRFNDSVILLNNFSNNKSEILENLKSVERHGSKTMLYNSIFDSINLIKDNNPESASVIIFTDGKDEGSTLTADDIVNHAKDNSIPLYFMCLKDSKNKQKLSRIAKLTGGDLLVGDKASEIPLLYSKIVQKLKSRYILKYNSQLKKNGQKHEIEVRLKYGSIRDRDKVFFYAPELFSLNFKNFNNETILLIVIFILLFLILLMFIRLLFLRKNKTEKTNKNNYKESDCFEKKRNSSYQNNDDYLTKLVENENQKFEQNEVFPQKNTYYSAWLIQKSGPELGEKFPIYWDEITIGRGRENTITVQDNSLSDKHIKIKKVNDRYLIFDLATDTGSLLNDKKLLRPKELFDWDEIKIGKTMFIFRGSKVQ